MVLSYDNHFIMFLFFHGLTHLTFFLLLWFNRAKWTNNGDDNPQRSNSGCILSQGDAASYILCPKHPMIEWLI